MKRQILINTAVILLIVAATLAGNALLSLTEHPAYSHADYVWGNRMVIDNETPFEYDLDYVYAEYDLLNDGSVSITNYGTDKKGHQTRAHAVGRVAGEGMLSVSFIPVLRFPSSSYRVLYVDDEYNYALVSDKKGSCLWFLGRSPQSTKDAISILKYEADARGFNTENLRYTAQGS